MLGISKVFVPPVQSVPRNFPATAINFFIPNSFPIRTPTPIPRTLRSRFLGFAENDNGSNNGIKETENGENGQEDSKRDRKPFFSVKWRELLDPNPDNIFAIGLTGLLTWASVQVLWQLFFISFAILVAALKYSFIAALLLFILITLL